MLYCIGTRLSFALCRTLFFWCCIAGAVTPLRADDFQGATHLVPFEEESIGYGKAVATGAVARLQARIDKGEATLSYDSNFGYLPSLLDALKIPRTSQMLVFSKTSFQRERIS